MARDRLHHGTAAIHWSADAPIFVDLSGAFAPVCGVDSVDFDRFMTRTWVKVTCLRCLRHKARLVRFTRVAKSAAPAPRPETREPQEPSR